MCNMVEIISELSIVVGDKCYPVRKLSKESFFLHIVYDDTMSEYEADSIPYFDHFPLYFMKLET